MELAADEAIDSRNMLDAFLGKSEKGLTLMLEEARGFAVRKGDWKYITGSTPNGKKKSTKDELYDLSSDIGEQKNLIKEKPELAKELRDLLKAGKQAKGGVRALWK